MPRGSYDYRPYSLLTYGLCCCLSMASRASRQCLLLCLQTKNSATETRTRVARVRAEYPNQLDYSGSIPERLRKKKAAISKHFLVRKAPPHTTRTRSSGSSSSSSGPERTKQRARDTSCSPAQYSPHLGKTTPVGFEPTRGDPIGLAGRRLNRSAKVSLATTWRHTACTEV